MMPKDAPKMIRSINIHHLNHIFGFSFFDKEGAQLWKIGYTTWSGLKVETVLIEENEVIIGVIAKLLDGYQSFYTEF